MLKNAPTRKARKERKKRRARNELVSSVVTTYREKLADAPDAAVKRAHKKKAARRARIAKKREPEPQYFYIGGSGK